jgi:hypothetical protein
LNSEPDRWTWLPPSSVQRTAAIATVPAEDLLDHVGLPRLDESYRFHFAAALGTGQRVESTVSGTSSARNDWPLPPRGQLCPAGLRRESDATTTTAGARRATLQRRRATKPTSIAWPLDACQTDVKRLEQCRTALDRAGRLVRQAAEQMIPYARIDPTERHILWIFNKAIPSHDTAQQYLAQLVADHKAQTQGAKP